MKLIFSVIYNVGQTCHKNAAGYMEQVYDKGWDIAYCEFITIRNGGSYFILSI
jgi:hypothetical protein